MPIITGNTLIPYWFTTGQELVVWCGMLGGLKRVFGAGAIVRVLFSG